MTLLTITEVRAALKRQVDPAGHPAADGPGWQQPKRMPGTASSDGPPNMMLSCKSRLPGWLRG